MPWPIVSTTERVLLLLVAVVAPVPTAAARAAEHPRLVDLEKTECSACHGDLLSRGVAHAVAEQDCTNCHEVTVGEQGTTVELLDSDPALCVLGHDELTAATELELEAPHLPAADSCLTCHDPHGSTENRALIRFGADGFVPGISPSARTGRLEFISSMPGSGSCYLTCHGEDHEPESYGGGAPITTLETLDVLVPAAVLFEPSRRPATGLAEPCRNRERIPPWCPVRKVRCHSSADASRWAAFLLLDRSPSSLCRSALPSGRLDTLGGQATSRTGR